MHKKTIIVTITVLCIVLVGFIYLKDHNFLGRKNSFVIETSDVNRFWNAYDNLKTQNTTRDSINIIQQLYLNKMSKAGKVFIDIRKYSANEYIETIKKYPRYFLAL